MIKWSPFPFLRITGAFICGILLAFQFEVPVWPALSAFGVTFCLFLLTFFAAKFRKSAFLFLISGLMALLAFVCAGATLTQLRTQKNDPNHLLRQAGKITHYQGWVNDFILEKPNVFQTVLQVRQVKVNGKWRHVEGQVQLSFRKEKDLKVPVYGDILIIKDEPHLVKPPLNPGQFDYRKYLAAHNIYHQHYLYPGQFEKTGSDIRNPLLAQSIRFRHKLDMIIKEMVPSHREYGIASALVLGIKDELDNEIKATYSNTGTMHVLAVSGLHVALVFQLLSMGLKRLKQTVSHRLISALIVLTVVWSYAFITALSPSVLRAVVMFSFVIGSKLLQRHANMYNTLAAAAFTLFCFDPYFLLDVGFQLSFLAVVSIVYLQPELYKLLTFKNYVADKFWSWTCVSLAAQVGTFALSLYYFHQFPVYFLLSNLVAVPLSELILIDGFLVLFLCWVPYVGFWLGKLMQGMLWVMNEAMMAMESVPYALVSRIPFSASEAILMYVFILLLLVFLALPKLKYLAVACAILAVISFSHVKTVFASAGQHKFMVMAVPKQSVYTFLGGNTTVLADSAFLENKQAIAFNLEPVLLQIQPAKVSFQPWSGNAAGLSMQRNQNGQSLIVWQGLRILVLEKPIKPDLKKALEVDYIVFRKNVWISPEKLSRNFQFKKLVFDSSCDSWYVRWLGKKLKAAKLPFHDVNSQGVFTVLR